MRFNIFLCVIQLGMITPWWLHLCFLSSPHVATTEGDEVARHLVRTTPFKWNFKTPIETTCAPTVATVQLTVDEIAVGILTATQNVATRLHAQRRTWLRLVPHKVFYSELVPEPEKRLNLEEQFLPIVFVGPSPHETLIGGGAWKDFPALIDLYKRFPRQKWFLLTVCSN